MRGRVGRRARCSSSATQPAAIVASAARPAGRPTRRNRWVGKERTRSTTPPVLQHACQEAQRAGDILAILPRSPSRSAEVAQLVEHVTENHGVGGSIPSLGTNSSPLVSRSRRAQHPGSPFRNAQGYARGGRRSSISQRSPRSPWPFFALVRAGRRRSCALARPTSSDSLNRPRDPRRT